MTTHLTSAKPVTASYSPSGDDGEVRQIMTDTKCYCGCGNVIADGEVFLSVHAAGASPVEIREECVLALFTEASGVTDPTFERYRDRVADKVAGA